MTTHETFYVPTYKDKRIGQQRDEHFWQALLRIFDFYQGPFNDREFKRDEEGSMRLFEDGFPKQQSSQHHDDDTAKDDVAKEIYYPYFWKAGFFIHEVTHEEGRIIMIDGRSLVNYIDDGLNMRNASPEERQKAIEDTYTFFWPS